MGYCPNCNQKLANESQVNEHLKTHPEGVDRDQCYYKCPINGCRYKTLQLGNLRRSHMSQHTGIRQNFCMDCGVTFGGASSLTRHRKSLHGYNPGSQGRRQRATAYEYSISSDNTSPTSNYTIANTLDGQDSVLSSTMSPRSPPEGAGTNMSLSPESAGQEWQHEAFTGALDTELNCFFGSNRVSTRANQIDTTFRDFRDHEMNGSVTTMALSSRRIQRFSGLSHSTGTYVACDLSATLPLSCEPWIEEASSEHARYQTQTTGYSSIDSCR